MQPRRIPWRPALRAEMNRMETKNMIQTIRLPQLGQFMARHFVDVFGTMLSMQTALSAKQEPPHFHERISGSVGFAGENVNGAIYVHFSEAMARRATSAMLGLTPEDVSGDSEVNDVIGEVANMLTGGLKSWLCDAGAPCAMSTPAIIRGSSFVIEPMPEVEREWLGFECGDERVVVEIHIKLS